MSDPQAQSTPPQATLTVRRASDRGHANLGWLDTWHTFSFADYYDHEHMGFRSLRVINDDRIAPGAGFPTHAHRDMEIITYVLDGAVEHKDSMDNGSVIRPGEVQKMSAGTGVRHSEFNHSHTEPLHLLQIWIIPAQRGLSPNYEQKSFSVSERRGHLCLVASPNGENNSITIHQDVRIYASVLDRSEKVSYEMNSNRYVWLHVARGRVSINHSVELGEGDGAAVEGSSSLVLEGIDNAEILLFDLN